MSMGTGAFKLVGPGNALTQEVSMATLQAATTKHLHTEWLSGILANQKIVDKLLVSETASKRGFTKDCKQTTVSKGYKEPLLKA